MRKVAPAILSLEENKKLAVLDLPRSLLFSSKLRIAEVARTTGERGFSTLELTMALPLVVFAMLFLIGMGHALITKQHAVVGGQFAAHHHRVREAGPNAAMVGKVVSGGGEAFRLSGGGDETITYKASTTPQKGLIAQNYALSAATSQYQTPMVTNACVPRCKPFDSFAKLLSPELITGIIFSGNSGSLSKDDLLSIVSGKGKKNRRQKPPGAVAASPAQKGSGKNTPGNGGPQQRGSESSTSGKDAPPSRAGGGTGPPAGPPGGGRRTGGADDGEPDDNKNGRNGNGDKGGNGNGNGQQSGKNTSNNTGNNGGIVPVPVPRPASSPKPSPPPRPSPTPRPSPSPKPSPTPRPSPSPTPRPSPSPSPSPSPGGTNRTPHAEERKRQADEGDTHRQVGDANRVRQQGRPFRDSETGNTVYVDGDRVVIVDPQGIEVSRFRNSRRNTQQRIRSGKWIPINRED